MKFEFDFEKILEILKLLPRKIIGGIILVWLMGDFAVKGVDWKVLVVMGFLSICVIASHWALEAGIWMEKKEPDIQEK